MAEPACKDCKFFYQPPLTNKGGECMDPTKRIFPRRTASSEVDPPEIIDEEIYTCRNWTSKDAVGGLDYRDTRAVKAEPVPLMIGFEKRTIELKSTEITVGAGWHEIHDGATGECAVQLQLEWMRSVLKNQGRPHCGGVYARGPFEIELHGHLEADGSIGYISVSLADKNDRDGYTFATVGQWIVRLPNREVVVRRDWKPGR
jgi:hypothetical protein